MYFSDRDNGNVRYAESSMRNGFGLRFLHKFLSMPYLTLQVCPFTLRPLNYSKHSKCEAFLVMVRWQLIVAFDAIGDKAFNKTIGAKEFFLMCNANVRRYGF